MYQQSIAAATESEGWTASLVTSRARRGWRGEASRLVIGLALASLYGVALGARHGSLAMVVQAVGVPLGFVAVALLAAPAFYILLAHAGHPIGPLGLAAAVSQATATAGLMLAGLAPGAALITVSVEADATAAVYGMLGLVVGGGLGLRCLCRQLGAELQQTAPGQRLAGWMVTVGFACFAALLAMRVWWLAVPSLGGGS
jgi:hypothetical protein